MPKTTINTSTGGSPVFDLNTIDRFSYYLRYNIQTFMELYSYFVQNNLQAIIAFYSDSVANADKESFDFLADLLTESAKVKTLIRLNKNSFGHTDDWELLDFLQTIDIKLQTFNNSAKWLRSSKTQNSWQGNSIQTQLTLSDQQTLEQVSEQIYGSKTSQDDWMRIAVENDLAETDYGSKSNTQVSVTKKNASSPNYSLTSVLDNLINQKLYGIDINRKLSFANNDLVVLTYNDTVGQSAEILISLKKGDMPEFSSIGVDASLAVGVSYGSLKISSIARQLQEVFATDDSLRNFQITNVSYSNGALTISYQVNTFYNLVYNSSTSIQQV